MRRFVIWSLVLLWSLEFGTWSFAQAPLNDLVFTVATTARSGGTDYSYVLIGSSSAQLLTGKRFAVFGKPGAPDSAATFTQRGLTFQRSDPTEINTLLSSSIALGQNLTSLADSLNTLLRGQPGISNQALAQKIITAFVAAATNRTTATLLRLMAHSNPGLSLAMGQGFSEPIGSTTTYEVRELDPATSSPGDVIARITVTPGSPVVLPAPGRPFQVMTNHPSDDLTIKLRWGTPNELRRLSLLSYGFNLWRITRSAAEAGNFHVTPPTTAQLLSNPSFIRITEAPASATKDFPATGADDPTDRTTYFFADDNNQSESGQAFADGAEFYYFVTARDILGRDGLVSLGGLTRACKRLTPSAPTDLAVLDDPLVVNSNVQQRFRITWLQNTNTNDVVTHYWVYRWPNPSQSFTNEWPLSNRVGVVSHVPGTNRNSFLDNTAGSPNTPGVTSYWYTARSVNEAACGPLLSPHSAPASGVLRERSGPDAPTGRLLGSCGTPAVIYSGLSTTSNPAIFNADRYHFRFHCDRRDSGIAWVQFSITNNINTNFPPIYFPPDGNRVSVDLSFNAPQGGFLKFDVLCVVGTQYGGVSRPAKFVFVDAPVPPGERWEPTFLAGQVLATAASPSDPLVNAINSRFGGNSCFGASNVRVDPSGTVTMQFAFSLPAPPVMIQASTNGGVWYDVGLAVPDSNGVYSISYPACLLGPLPALSGCVLDLAADIGCPQHIPRASIDGTVAPINVEFGLTRRTREYRLYRAVGDGVLSLISQGPATYDPARPGFRVVVSDDAMPVVSARLCYYVQLFDEHGNPSPMTLIDCRESKPPTLPRPVLAEPLPAGDTNNPQVTLNWFAPTSGVHRFRILLERLDRPKTNSLSGFDAAQLRRDVSFPKSSIGYVGGPVAAATAPAAPISSLKFLGLLRDPSTAIGTEANRHSNFSLDYHLRGQGIAISFDEAYLTPPIGPDFGPGPSFALDASVLLNARYRISVTALNSQGDWGPPSEAVEFQWQPSLPPAVVPWPARPLPFVNHDFNPRLRATLLTNNPAYPVGIRIARIYSNIDAGQANYLERNGDTFLYFNYYNRVDPGYYLLRDVNGNSVLPAVLYRMQVTNSNFPGVSGDCVQVSPLIERIAWEPLIDNGELYGANVVDTYIELEQDTEFRFYNFCLRDLQPVIRGAAYQYFLVRFKPNREIDQIIPAGEVEIPN